MDRLWAPWRIKYVQSKKTGGCLFCRASRASGARGRVVFRTAGSICMLNIFPYNNGHLMVAPLRHTGTLERLGDAETLDLFRAVKRAQKLLDGVLQPHGYNIGLNIGSAAGAGIPSHVHVHVVPRWRGDTNFMPVAGSTKVISQSLDELYRRLLHAEKNTP
ncbi:MAG: HIT domain-containing protein [Candidatus Omnitrophica bacterium]|nr:HIT domain-containing protein [Candidatus Omnitrophota bacterium]